MASAAQIMAATVVVMMSGRSSSKVAKALPKLQAASLEGDPMADR